MVLFCKREYPGAGDVAHNPFLSEYGPDMIAVHAPSFILRAQGHTGPSYGMMDYARYPGSDLPFRCRCILQARSILLFLRMRMTIWFLYGTINKNLEMSVD